MLLFCFLVSYLHYLTAVFSFKLLECVSVSLTINKKEFELIFLGNNDRLNLYKI